MVPLQWLDGVCGRQPKVRFLHPAPFRIESVARLKSVPMQGKRRFLLRWQCERGRRT